MPASRIWTIGHSTRSADAFIALLKSQRIDRLADIRTIPQSRRHPHFGRDALAARLAGDGVQYRHFPELGGLRKPRPDSPNAAWKNQAFRGYADHMQTPPFSTGVDALLGFAGEGRLTVMCAEAVWWQCHRMLLADALTARGIAVEHILSETSVQPHRLTPFARVGEHGALTYPGETKVSGNQSNSTEDQ
jgi:uncharacterized protein (DUF488 family)